MKKVLILEINLKLTYFKYINFLIKYFVKIKNLYNYKTTKFLMINKKC